MIYGNDSPRNAVGEIMPVLFATTIAIPVSRNGNEKSIACDLSKLILRDVITMSAWWLTRAATRPFHRPFCGHKNGTVAFICDSSGQLFGFVSDMQTFATHRWLLNNKAGVCQVSLSIPEKSGTTSV